MTRVTSGRAVIGIALSIAIGCAPQPATHLATPTPVTASTHSDPDKLIVRLGDLPAGYRLEGDEAVTLESMSESSDRAIVRDQALRTGFVSGRTRLFSLDADAPSGDRTAAVYLFVFKDAAAAREALDTAAPKDPSISRFAIGEAVGENSHGYRFTRTASDGTAREALMIQFQFANTLSYVLVQGVPRSPTAREVTAIAQKQVALLHADAVGPALTTPSPRTKPVTKVSADLGLRVADLPAGFTTETSVALAPEDIAEDDADLAFWHDVGMRRSWGAVFQSPDGTATVTSVVVLPGTARVDDAYRHVVKNASEGVYEISLGTTLGDESVGFEDHGGRQGAPLTSRSVYFRFGDAIGWVNVLAPTGAVEAAFVIDLATELIGHLE